MAGKVGNPYHDAKGLFSTAAGDADGKPATAKAAAKKLGLKPKPLETYHGTTEAALQSILKDGLKVMKEGYVTNRDHSGIRDEAVYVAKNEHEAQRWADAKFSVPRNSAVVLKVEIPADDEKFKGFVKHGGIFPKEGVYHGTIPPSYIKGVSRLKYRKEGEGRNIRWTKVWEPYKEK